MRVPSGDHAGCEAGAYRVMSWRPLPSGLTRKRWPNEDTSAARTIVLPSGDQDGEVPAPSETSAPPAAGITATPLFAPSRWKTIREPSGATSGRRPSAPATFVAAPPVAATVISWCAPGLSRGAETGGVAAGVQAGSTSPAAVVTRVTTRVASVTTRIPPFAARLAKA